MGATTSVHRTIDAVWRMESAKVIAALARYTRDVGLAEEMAQDALVAALEQWPAEARAAMLEEAGPTFLAVDFRLLGDPWVDSMRQLMPVYSWTVRSAGQRETGQVHADALIWEGDGRP